jgi:hypothetical protein
MPLDNQTLGLILLSAMLVSMVLQQLCGKCNTCGHKDCHCNKDKSIESYISFDDEYKSDFHHTKPDVNGYNVDHYGQASKDQQKHQVFNSSALGANDEYKSDFHHTQADVNGYNVDHYGQASNDQQKHQVFNASALGSNDEYKSDFHHTQADVNGYNVDHYGQVSNDQQKHQVFNSSALGADDGPIDNIGSHNSQAIAMHKRINYDPEVYDPARQSQDRFTNNSVQSKDFNEDRSLYSRAYNGNHNRDRVNTMGVDNLNSAVMVNKSQASFIGKPVNGLTGGYNDRSSVGVF